MTIYKIVIPENMRTIKISEEEYTDRLAVEAVKGGASRPEEHTLFQELYDIHKSMYPLHDVLTRTNNIELKAYLGEVVLELNGIRSKLKNENRTYAKCRNNMRNI